MARQFEEALREIIRCPECLGPLELTVEELADGAIRRGCLSCSRCGHDFPIVETMVFFGISRSAASLRRQEMDAEYRWNFEMHGLDEHLAYAPISFRMAEDAIRQLATVLSPGAMVLDVGAGCGYHTWQLIKHGFRAIAAEMAPEFLAYGDVVMEPGVWFERLVSDCSLLPLADGSVDAVFCKELAHHVEDLPALVAEFRRVLKAAGVLAVVEPCWARYLGAQAILDSAAEAGLTHQPYGFGDYQRALADAGFRLLRFRTYRERVAPFMSRVARVSNNVLARVFGLKGWAGWRWLKSLQARRLGGEVAVLACKTAAPVAEVVRDRAIEVLSPKRLEDLREAIEQKRREVPAFMKILREVYSGKDAG